MLVPMRAILETADKYNYAQGAFNVCLLYTSDIDIPYPRTQETRLSPEFNKLKNEVWGEVYKEYLEVRK